MRRVARLVRLSYAHERGIYGNGVVVAVVDSGIAIHGDFFNIPKKNRLIVAVDMVNGRDEFYDDNGHGTHVAGIIGGGGRIYTGMAPMCGLVSVKVLDYLGNGNLRNVLDGLQWILNNGKKYNIRIVNISVGTPASKMFNEDSKLVQKVEELWNEGYIVLAASGNNGPNESSIGAPGISRKIITVGAVDDDSAIAGGSGVIKNYSGRGPTYSCIKKPDIVAPGSGIYSCNNAVYGRKYTVKSGTSMSTPVVSGAIALLLSVYPDMTNKEVKIRLKETAVNLGLPHNRQGWGVLDVGRLLGDYFNARYYKRT